MTVFHIDKFANDSWLKVTVETVTGTQSQFTGIELRRDPRGSFVMVLTGGTFGTFTNRKYAAARAEKFICDLFEVIENSEVNAAPVVGDRSVVGKVEWHNLLLENFDPAGTIQCEKSNSSANPDAVQIHSRSTKIAELVQQQFANMMNDMFS